MYRGVVQVDFFNEVSIMQALEDSWSAASAGGLWTNPVPSPRAVQLLDFGIDTTAEAMFIVMRDYRCSLRSTGRLWESSSVRSRVCNN